MQEQITKLTPRQIYSRAYKLANKEKSRAWYEANKASENEKSRAWREANPDYMSGYNRAYYEAHKEACKEEKRAYREANPDKFRAWVKANPEYFLEYSRAYREANPEKVRNAKVRRRDAPGEITPGYIPKLLELQRWTCIVCLKDLRYGYHIDHIYPVSKGGENTDYNLQALCPKCNHEKSNKDPIDFMRSRGFLL